MEKEVPELCSKAMTERLRSGAALRLGGSGHAGGDVRPRRCLGPLVCKLAWKGRLGPRVQPGTEQAFILEAKLHVVSLARETLGAQGKPGWEKRCTGSRRPVRQADGREALKINGRAGETQQQRVREAETPLFKQHRVTMLI